ncbi:MAG TPA: ATP synthase F0 subunit B [Caldithrix sp.]|nr:ATP synthase F0 subunit B [Caldithrix sp.]
MLQLEPGMMIWTWVTFFVLFAVLLKVAWKPLLGMVEQREKTVEDAIRRAEEARNEAEQLLEKHQDMMAQTQGEIQKMLQENKQVAENMKNDIVRKARSEAQKLQERAQQDIEREKEAAIIELRKQVADLSIYAASRLIRENLDEKKHRSLIDQYIKDLDQMEKN